ncbi:rRNA biogenesis protein rrp5 [Paracerasibacillus soli]|uniref:rRNA biogenesis protein rrp5 n=1 Tax=Paracerasibacillus soli TaxID=480284 RepID=A0ABU5CXK7_9BACI|nr:rRNA biogenesis protein rrp5 [Virgibacillus soli]MDY0410621.1 rRNA biogenesis protein rrp5 [Virgibacillus soli]
MSRTKLLLDVVTDLQNLAGSLQTIAEVLANNEESPRTEEKAPVKKAKPKKKEISLEEVRTLLAQRVRLGLRQILKSYLKNTVQPN